MNSMSLRATTRDLNNDLAGRHSPSSSNIRPRNRRLVSTELQNQEVEHVNVSRGVSPIPSQHPSRVRNQEGYSSNGTSLGDLLSPRLTAGAWTSGTSKSLGKGLWEGGWTGSWTALQGLASSVLGGDVSDNEVAGSVKSGRRSAKRAPRLSSTARAIPSEWGPSASEAKKGDHIGVGSTAAREQAVKARKTANVLESRETFNSGLDAAGRHKRRTSLEEPCPQDPEEDALVYVHPVQANDTLAGVILKYGCQPTAFKKANRLWPNDIIQIRKVVLLPVEACTARGKPCNPPEDNRGTDLLAPTPGIEEGPLSPPFTNGGTLENMQQPSPFANLPCASSRVDAEGPAWIHVRWVLLDTSQDRQPTEIARLPRKTLGYFPPRRRKSQSLISAVTTPRRSFDITASSIASSPAESTTRRASHLGPKPVPGSYFPSAVSAPATRRGSVSGAADWMRGPGGVGTMNRNVRKPGPAQDGLNSWAAKHIPGLTIDYLPSTSVVTGETASLGFREELASIDEGGYKSRGMDSGTHTPSGAGQGMALEHAAAAIEGWVRRLAIKTPAGTPRLRSSSKGPDVGDLIELLDGTGSDDGRAFEPAAEQAGIVSLDAHSAASSRGDTTTNLRGRFRAGSDTKAGKSD